MSRELRRTYRTVPVWQDLALLTLVLVVGVGLVMTWLRFH